MSDLAGFGGLLSGVGNFISNGMNFGLQVDQRNWERRKYEEMLRREDTATQRRAADLEAAGLSKTLAAGSAAGTSQVMKTTLPQMGKMDNPVALFLEAQQMKKNIEQTQAEINLKNASAMKASKETEWIDRINGLDLERRTIDNAHARLMNPRFIKEMDLKIDKMGIENSGKRLDNIIKQNNIDKWNLYGKTYAALMNEYVQAGVDQRKADVLVKQALVELYEEQEAYTNVQKMEKEHNLNFWRKKGMPTNYPLNAVTGTADYAASTASGILESIGRLFAPKDRR